MDLVRQILAVISKDMQLELRSKYALNTVLAFVSASLLVVIFALRAHRLEPAAQSGLIWIIILFAALSSLSRSFVRETERHTFDLLRLHSRPTVIYTGKLIYNFLFTLFVNMVTFALFIVLMELDLRGMGSLTAALLLGSAGLAGVTTLMAAIVSQADRSGAIFSVVSLPLLIPLILILVRATRSAFAGGSNSALLNDVTALIGYAGVTVTAGILLFDYIWDE